MLIHRRDMWRQFLDATVLDVVLIMIFIIALEINSASYIMNVS